MPTRSWFLEFLARRFTEFDKNVHSYFLKSVLFQVLEIDDNVFIGVELINAELGVNVVVEKAWATPLPSPYHSPIQIPIVDQG